MTDTKQQIIDEFVIEMVLLKPIGDIIIKLENREFMDCDISWLNNKLNNFAAFSLETMGKKVPMIYNLIDNSSVMNRYVAERFINAFQTLLDYFKNITQ
jgi:hypothetical protein